MREDPFKNVNVKGVNAFISFLKKLIAIVSLYHILVIVGAAIFAFGLFYAISAARPDTLQYLKRQYNKEFAIESKEVNEKKDGTYIVYPKDTPDLKVTVTRYRYKYQDNYKEQLINYYYEKEKNSELFSGFNIVRRDLQKDVTLEKNVYNLQEFKDTARQIYDLKLFFREKSPNLEYSIPIGMKYGNYTAYLWIQDAAGDKENLVKKAMKDYISYLKNNNYSLSEISDEDLNLWSPDELDIKINGTYVKDYTGKTSCKMVFLTEKQEHVIFLYQVFNYIDGVNILKKENNMVKEFQYNGKDYIITSGMKPLFRDITKINSYVTIDEFKQIFNADIKLDYENAIVNINIRRIKE